MLKTNHTIIAAATFGLCFLIYACDKKVGKEPVSNPPASTTGSTNPCDNVKYSTTIKPIIETKCAISGCHVSGFGFGDFTTYAGLKQKIDDGTFKDRVFDPSARSMPPPANGGVMPTATLALIQCWLDKGANND